MEVSKPPFDRTPKNSMEAMMQLLWLWRNAPEGSSLKDKILDEIAEHGRERCTKEEIDQAMFNMKEFNYFIKE